MKINTTLAFILLSALLPASALSSADITATAGSNTTMTGGSSDRTTLVFKVASPAGSALEIRENQKLEASFTMEDGTSITQTGDLQAFFVNKDMGKDNALRVQVSFPALEGCKSIVLKDSLKILGADSIETSKTQSLDMSKGGELKVDALVLEYKKTDSNNMQGISLDYSIQAGSNLAGFVFYDQEGKEMKSISNSTSTSGDHKHLQYIFEGGQLPTEIAIQSYKGMKDMSIDLDLHYGDSDEASSGFSSSSSATVSMSTQSIKKAELLDMSKMTPAQKKFIYTTTAYMLVGQAKLMEEDKLDDVSAMMAAVANMMNKSNSPDLPQDYQDYLKASSKLYADAAKQLKGKDSSEAVMGIMFMLMPKMDALNKKYPEMVAFVESANLSLDSASPNFLEDAGIIFGMEKQMAAYAKKLKSEGITDEKEQQIKLARAAGSFLMKKAKAVK